MSRSIKFRAWDTKREEMCYDVTIFANGWTGCVFNNGDEWSYHPDAKIIKMQYTGLKDKNGIEIYEGDLLRYPFKDKWEETNYVAFEVFYHDNDCADNHVGFQMNRIHFHGSIGGYSMLEKFLPKYTNKLEVIGNIYENPELNKGGKP